MILVTNGSLLTNKTCNDLLLADLSQIRISVDSADKKTYNMLRPGLDFDALVENIKSFIATRNRTNSACKIIARVTYTEENKNDIQKIKLFWSNIGCSVVVRNETDIPNIQDKKYSSKHKTACKCPLRTLTIKANGNVVLCCKDWYGWYISGNVYRDKPLDIFNSAKFRELRCSMANGENYPSICDICINKHRRHK